LGIGECTGNADGLLKEYKRKKAKQAKEAAKEAAQARPLPQEQSVNAMRQQRKVVVHGANNQQGRY